MTELFSDNWMNGLKDQWNAEPEVKNKLAEINFSSTITCGFKNEVNPTGVFVVENGECVRAGSWNGEEADWDMRADADNWGKWVKKPLGMTSMGMAVATGKLKFNKGDFGAMIKNPSMAGPFIKSFALMTKIDV
ncbi:MULTISPECIES: SCP2 sterol-binding domain-containing protein [Thiomicrorhabdus]|uniref:SCP2 sterol-binding domain-containing protein n=1 Tax=Thiomicrorhabdus heinhorstiae TaxID=2748010 RepID=A0ABS0BVS7_9GAMM|nr:MULTISPECIES: SCP2 sterol-binding domain-containing protein [Thiomicrorhabdus]MBF6057474.1 SCP2 sterol-binding domain-containing protein [Thiomicrorhabdus heinhorstiae]